MLRRTDRRTRRNSRHPRRGVETVQVLLILPILVIAIWAIFEFAILVLVQQSLVTAVVEGSREAAKDATPTEVRDEVQQYLDIHGITLAPGSGARLLVEDDTGVIGDFGDNTVTCNVTGPVLTTTEVRVTLCVLVSQNGKPVPDFLSTFGFTLAGERYEISEMAQRELPFPAP